MGDESSIKELAKRLFDCVEKNDMDGLLSCYAADATVWNNTDEKTISPGEIAAILGRFDEIVTEKGYEQRDLKVFPGGFVQRHLLSGTRRTDGHRVAVPACLVAEVADGRIARSFDYIDTAKLAEFFK